MSLFCEDNVLNVSSAYLRPGFAFGGSCLPKDLRSLLHLARTSSADLPMLAGTLATNELVISDVVNRVVASDGHTVALLGLSFKTDTDDLRESPAVEFAEALLGKGYELRIVEPTISPGSIYGSNLRFIEQSIPHIWKLLTTEFEQVVRESEVVVLMAPLDPNMREALRLFRPGQVCFDFAHAIRPGDLPAGEYRSLTHPSGPEHK